MKHTNSQTVAVEELSRGRGVFYRGIEIEPPGRMMTQRELRALVRAQVVPSKGRPRADKGGLVRCHLWLEEVDLKYLDELEGFGSRSEAARHVLREKREEGK